MRSEPGDSASATATRRDGRRDVKDTVTTAIAEHLTGAGIEFAQPAAHTLVAVLPGEHKLTTTVSIVVGEHTVTFNAFVIRNPDENHLAVYKWLLERNRRSYGVAYAIDHLGDIYLAGRTPLSAIDDHDLDRLLGSILENADGAFDLLLELGFATAIRREWDWRISRGESAANLRAFAHLLSDEPSPGDGAD